MVRQRRPFAASATALLALVATMAWTGEASAQRYSAAYCDAYARDVSWRQSRGGAVGGAARGAAGGAAIGAIVNGGRGARRGAAIGAVTGGTTRGVQRGSIYNRAYHDCMRGVVGHY